MSELRRWSEEGASGEERALLDSSRSERPAPAARLRALHALGLPEAAQGAASGTDVATTEPSAQHGAGAAGRLGALGKTVLIGSLVAAIGAGVAWRMSAPKSGPMSAPKSAALTAALESPAASSPSPAALAEAAPPAPAPGAASAPVGSNPSVEMSAAAESRSASAASAASGAAGVRRHRRLSRPPGTGGRAPTSLSAAPAPSASPAPRAPAPAPGSPSAPPTPPAPAPLPPTAESTLAEEVAALETARTALADHDGAAALRALDGYRARFHHGTLFAEETVLRVQGLRAEGADAKAAALVDAFCAAHPGSSYVGRLRQLVRRAGSP
jgi:hypothetical protein